MARDERRIESTRRVFVIGTITCTFEQVYEYEDSGTSRYPGEERRYSQYAFRRSNADETVYEVRIGEFKVVLGPCQSREVRAEKVPGGKQHVVLLDRFEKVVEEFDIYIS